MHSSIILLSVAASLAVAAPIHLVGEINHPSTINKLNAENDTWVAGENKIFNGKSFAETKKFLGTLLFPQIPEAHASLPASVAAQHDAVSDVPASFDSRTQWGAQIHPIRNQLQCGSCWAFSASEVLSDRFSIQSNATTPVLSAEDLVSCDKGDMGCQGGMLPAAWTYLQNTGLVADTCFPYTAGAGQAAACPSSNTCPGTGTWTKSKAKSAYSLTTVEAMQKDIMTNGPIQVAFMVYKSFMSYKSGVYKKKFTEFTPEGGHAVKIVGWGVDGSTPYWTVANSWGTGWGMNGFFNILRGKDECKIESAGPPYAGLAQL